MSFVCTVILGFCAVLCATFVQGITGFGFALLAVPVLSLFLPLKVAVVIIPIQGIVIGCAILYRAHPHLKIKKLILLTIVSIAANPFGVYLLKILSAPVLQTVIGVLVCISAAAKFFNYKFPIKHEKVSYMLTGLLSGLLNGSISQAGPPVILFLANRDVPKDEFRANITLYFLILSLVSVPMYYASGFVTKELLVYSAFFLPATCIGVGTGILLSKRVSEEHFKRATLVLVSVMGIVSFVTGLFALMK